MEGKIVFKGKTKSGKEIIIRHPRDEDLREMWSYINALSQEKTFIRYQGEEISFVEEEKFLKDLLQKIKEKKNLTLVAFHNDKLIGISGVEMRDKVEKHVGLFGISIAKEYRREGIGYLLMKFVIEEAVSTLPLLKIIKLGVFSINTPAKKMYEKFGFKEFGRLPKGLFYQGKYIDQIYMYKSVK